MRRMVFEAAVCLLALALVAYLCLACTTAKRVGGEIGGTAAEWIACPTELIDCGYVWLCDDSVEICVDDTDEAFALAEDAFGACEPTPRHQGLCWWRCPSEKGCNAFAGCFCPEAP